MSICRIELAMNTITADNKIGSHSAWIETIFASSKKFYLCLGRAPTECAKDYLSEGKSSTGYCSWFVLDPKTGNLNCKGRKVRKEAERQTLEIVREHRNEARIFLLTESLRRTLGS